MLRRAVRAGMGKADVVFCGNGRLPDTTEVRRRILDGPAASRHRRGALFPGHRDGSVPPPKLFQPPPCPGGVACRRA
jgi:hypothetical protein